MSGSDPVVTPAGHGMRNALGAVGVVALCAVAVAGIYFWPSRQTAESQRERAEANTADRGKYGDPGKPFRKPGGYEIPDATPAAAAVVAEKPGTQAPIAIAQARRRPQPSAVSTWTAPAPPTRTAAATDQGQAQGKDDGRPTKLAGLPVMQAERIDDASWYLMPGEMIMCRNDQPLTEKTGAFWTATIPEEKLSRDGSRRLIPAKSQAFGTIVSGFNRGDRRLAAVITHISGPSVPGKPTLFIPIDMGQVGDDIGRVDMKGNVENDFWSRLGTVGAYAALDALARGGASYATGTLNRALNGGGDGVNVNIGNLGGAMTGRTLSGSAYQDEINKQPEFNRPQAQPCSIMITKPVDFRKALHIGK